MGEVSEAEAGQIVTEERDKDRTVYIEIAYLKQSDFLRLRNKLKKHMFKLTSRIPCTISIKDDEGTDIRQKDDW